MDTLTPKQLVAQALVLYADGGKYATELMNAMEQGANEADEQERLDMLGVPDDATVPEGMSGLREGSLGVVS